MTTFQPIILQCPSCKQKMYDYELMSYTVNSSTVYSDSKTITDSFVDDNRAFRFCPSCKQALWIEDAILDVENPYELVDSIPNALDVHDMPFNMSENIMQNKIDFYEKLLKQGFAYSSEKKYYLRIRLWWSMNDFVRDKYRFLSLFRDLFHRKRFCNLYKAYKDQKKNFVIYKDLFTDNLLQLIKLTNAKTEDDHLMLAEMYRELGQFRKAKKAIKIVNIDNSTFVNKLKRQIFLRRKRVFKL